MAILNITYFENLGRDSQGTTVLVGELPKKGTQALTYTANAVSEAIPKKTRFVRLLADADAYVEVGTAPVATVASMKLEANVSEYFGLKSILVRAGTLKIAAYDGTTI